MVNTKFWDDSYISALDPVEKLMFIYLLTNAQTNICGIYELSLKKMALDTGIDKDMVVRIIKRFTKDKKIFFVKGWVCIKNFVRHQNQKSPLVQKGIDNELSLVPSDILEKATQLGYGIDTLSHLIKSNLIKSNLIESNLIRADKPPKKAKFSNEGTLIIKAFEEVDPKNKTYYGNTTQRKAADFLFQEYGMDRVLELIRVLPDTNKIPYFPSITTAHDLKEKWVKLEDAFRKRQAEKVISKGKGLA